MTTELTAIYKGIKEQWSILKDESKPKSVRNLACNKIIKLSEQAKELDDKFEVFDFGSSKYADFMPVGLKPKSDVNWGTDIEEPFMIRTGNECKNLVSDMEKIAVLMTRERLPKEPEDSQKFGMITSAYTDKLLSAYYYFNS